MTAILYGFAFNLTFSSFKKKRESESESERKQRGSDAKKKIKLTKPRIELGTFCVLGKRGNQLHHPAR